MQIFNCANVAFSQHKILHILIGSSQELFAEFKFVCGCSRILFEEIFVTLGTTIDKIKIHQIKHI